MHYSIPSTEILLILRYQNITTQTKQYRTRKHDILQTRDCKDRLTTIMQIGFTFTVQLAYPVIIEISGRKRSLTQQPYELL